MNLWVVPQPLMASRVIWMDSILLEMSIKSKNALFGAPTKKIWSREVKKEDCPIHHMQHP